MKQIDQTILLKGYLGGSDSKESACNVGDQDWKDPLEEGIVTHSSIPTTEATGSQRFRHP